MGMRVARLVYGRVLDFVEMDGEFVIVRKGVPPSLVGKTLAEAGLRRRTGVTVVSVRRANAAAYEPAEPGTLLRAGDVIIVAGQRAEVDVFVALT